MKVTTQSQHLAEEIHRTMVSRGWTLATAESCTSGRVAAILTSVSGASDYFQGALVAYQDHLKVRYLDVSQDDIDRYDVVSRPVVEQMVRGCCQLFHTDFALASTGYAGSGCNGIPEGTIWLAWGNADEVETLCLTHSDGREKNTERAAQQLIAHFCEYLKTK